MHQYLAWGIPGPRKFRLIHLISLESQMLPTRECIFPYEIHCKKAKKILPLTICHFALIFGMGHPCKIHICSNEVSLVIDGPAPVVHISIHMQAVIYSQRLRNYPSYKLLLEMHWHLTWIALGIMRFNVVQIKSLIHK